MFKIAILLFAALVSGLTKREVTESFEAIADEPPLVAPVECGNSIDWTIDSAVDKEPGDGSHFTPYYAVLVGGSDTTPSSECEVKLALFQTGSILNPKYIQIAASAATDSTELQIGNVACAAVSNDDCAVNFGEAYHLPTLVGLSGDDVSTAVWCPSFEGALPGDGSGAEVDNAIWAYVDSADNLDDCGRVWKFGTKFVVVAGALPTNLDEITLQISQNDCTTISCSTLTDYAEWSSASYEPSTTQEPDTTPVEDTTTPVEDTTTPVEDTTTPVEDTTTTPEPTTTITEDTAPATEDTGPATEDTSPATEDTGPATEESSSSSSEEGSSSSSEEGSSSSSEEGSSSSEEITTTTAPPVNTQSSTSSTTTTTETTTEETTTEDSTVFAAVGFTLLALLA